jgi:Uma2 family endonuclease
MATETRTGRGPFTVADVLATPEDHVKRELIDGWLYIEGQPADSLDVAEGEVSGPSLRHQDVVGELHVIVRAHARPIGAKVYLAPTDVVLGDRVVQPDVLVIGPEDVAGLAGAPRIEGIVPRLVVEVSSPSTRSHDVLRKRRVYEEAGVPEFWFVDLDADRIETYVLDGERYPPPTIHERGASVGSVALPGLEVTVDEVLGDDPPYR